MVLYHAPLILDKLSFLLPHKTCFFDVTTTICAGDRIVLIGDNGTGKSTLLSYIAGVGEPSSGHVRMQDGLRIGYVPQSISQNTQQTVWQVATEYVADVLADIKKLDVYAQSPDLHDAYGQLLDALIAADAFTIEPYVEELLTRMNLFVYKDVSVTVLSGGQWMLLALVRALAMRPHLLLLDEPTNHLDIDNKKQLFTFLRGWKGTAVIISHNLALLRTWPTRVWHIYNTTMIQFDGGYDAYMQQHQEKTTQLVETKEKLEQEKKKTTRALEKEKARAAKSIKAGKRKYADGPKLVRGAKKRQAENTAGKKAGDLHKTHEAIQGQLRDLHIPETITPSFDLQKISATMGRVFISDGTVGYEPDKSLITQIDIALEHGQRMAVSGPNGSGKTTFIKALLDDVTIIRTGQWHYPKKEHLGYVDQSYGMLDQADTPLTLMQILQPTWTHNESRAFLNTFLFRKNEQVNARINDLSGGEKARLCLAVLAAQSPALIILDEITNNLDLTTRQHLIDVLNAYTGSIIAISHDRDFLQAIGIDQWYVIKEQKMVLQ